MGEMVRGVVLDESVLLCDGGDEIADSVSLRAGVEYLLRKLRYSNLRMGISYGPSLSSHKTDLLKKMAMLYSFECFVSKSTSLDDDLNDIKLAWGDIGGGILYLVSNTVKENFLRLRDHSSLVIVLYDDGVSTIEQSMLYINKLEELPLRICQLNKKALGNEVVAIGYVMKPSREEDFAKRGAFPMCPTSNGLIFMPITFSLPISTQLQEVDLVLHKATDEIISIDLSGYSEPSCNRITFSEGIQELRRYMEDHPECSAVDPLNNVYPVLDRLTIQQILLGLVDQNPGVRSTIRAPHFLKVDNFNDPCLEQRLSEAKVTLPGIVKPQVACGVAEAHSMAIVFRVEDFEDLSVPLPAVVQEYVDHSSTLFKFYVLGEKVFYAVKKSTPSGNTLMTLSEKNGLRVLHFDSLKSLPTVKENQHCEDGVCSGATGHSMDLELVTNAAVWLRSKLGLTIFGFDVVIQESTGDHVIVDVNYLPSFKEVPNDIAIPAFWDALKEKFESRKLK